MGGRETTSAGFDRREDLAAVAGVSESWFKARFRRELSIGPAEYVLRRRIDTACRLLSDPAIPITTIALDLGFSSSQNFATVFRRVMNTSPREFRKRRKA